MARGAAVSTAHGGVACGRGSHVAPMPEGARYAAMVRRTVHWSGPGGEGHGNRRRFQGSARVGAREAPGGQLSTRTHSRPSPGEGGGRRPESTRP